jgi:hypothetical protein
LQPPQLSTAGVADIETAVRIKAMERAAPIVPLADTRIAFYVDFSFTLRTNTIHNIIDSLQN